MPSTGPAFPATTFEITRFVFSFCAELQSGKLPPKAGFAQRSGAVVADEYAGQADKALRKGREPCSLCGVPVGRGGSPQSTV